MLLKYLVMKTKMTKNFLNMRRIYISAPILKQCETPDGGVHEQGQSFLGRQRRFGHIRQPGVWVRGCCPKSRPTWFRVIHHLNVFKSDQNCYKDPNLQAATPASESMLTNYVQIGPSHQQLTVYLFRIEVGLGFWAPKLNFLSECFCLGLVLCGTEPYLQTGPVI